MFRTRIMNIFIFVYLLVVTFKLGVSIPYLESPESYGIGSRDDEVDWSLHPCRRECKDDAKPLTCRYGFTVEMYTSMSKACYDCPLNVTDCSRPHCVPADGNDKVLIVVNRRLPGMTIEVCKGDRIVVDLTNNMLTETVTIHWHGLHQRKSPFMDGVPYVTQCPILPGEKFRYDFMADEVGTNIWHSHTGDMRSDGLFGGLIIRPTPRDNKVNILYDHDEHIMIVNEWRRISGPHSYVLEYQNGEFQKPHTILVNGLGRFNGSEKSKLMPLSTFTVEKNKRYRFRLMNIGSEDCPIHVSIDDHLLLLISADGADVQPISVDSIRILTGERYDFVLTADRKVDNYWIRLKGDANCAILNLHQLAILRYKGAPEIEPTHESLPSGDLRELNPFDKGLESSDAISVPSLNALVPDDISLTRIPDYQIYLSYDFYKLDTVDYHRKNLYGYSQVKIEKQRKASLQWNHITFQLPKFPLLTQPELIKPGQLCNSTTVKNCDKKQCVCTHVLSVKLDSVVELIIVDVGILHINHPMHLHGYRYRVVGMEKLSNTSITVDQVKALDKEGKIYRKLKRAPLKDTVIVPSGGYTILRFHANNPGYWLFHCHFDKHATNGMTFVLKVGEHEDFVKPPKHFPKCGDFET